LVKSGPSWIFQGTNPTDEVQDSNIVQGNVADDLLFDVSRSGRQLYLGARMKLPAQHLVSGATKFSRPLQHMQSFKRRLLARQTIADMP
jgi:hypothetical protein